MFQIRTNCCLVLKQVETLQYLLFKVMNYGISQKQIGQRLSELRKISGLSQEELSKRVSISRPSLAQIELGNRSVSILEIQKFSLELKFSLDDFMSINFSTNPITVEESAPPYLNSPERVGEPKFNKSKFTNVLLYILGKCAGKPNVNDIVLTRLMYFSDFNYFELYEEHMTGSKYLKHSYGPVPNKLQKLINHLIETDQLKRIKTKYSGISHVRYLPLVNSDLRELLASEKEVIDGVINQMSGWSDKMITDYSHNDIPWLSSKEGEEINYELAFYRAPPYSVRNYDDEKWG